MQYIKGNNIEALLLQLNLLWDHNFNNKYSYKYVKNIREILHEIIVQGYKIKDLDDLATKELKEISYECWAVNREKMKIEDERFSLQLESEAIKKGERDNLKNIRNKMKNLKTEEEIRMHFINLVLFNRPRTFNRLTDYVKLIDKKKKVILFCPPYSLWEGGLHDMFRSVNLKRNRK